MRSFLSISLVSLVALGACSQSLSSNKSGTGGMGGGGAETGGAGATTGPETTTGGAGGQSLCDTLTAAYQTAVRAEQTCAIGATGQCQQLVSATLSVCGSCETYVNDASKPNAIQQAWQAANCAKVYPPPPCALILCPAALNNVCAANPDDTNSTNGLCTYVPVTGGTGGSSGTGGTGGLLVDGGLISCTELSFQYGAALAAAKRCDVGGSSDQCAQQVPASLSGCSGACTAYVNDATTLNLLRQEWSQAGCGDTITACPAISCVPVVGTSCVAGDGGAGICTPGYALAR